MRIILLFIIVFLLAGYFAMAQSGTTVKGIVYDSIGKKTVQDATVTLLLRKDSSLVSFTLTDAAGRFLLSDLPGAAYRLLITHVAYHGKRMDLQVVSNDGEVNLGQIVVNDKRQVLDEVLVTAEAPPVSLQGDTLQYNAGSFRTVPYASVEQLLKKLPGIEVGRDGTVKAQGQKVSRVLVDGKEFFGNDPKMATKNLPADAVDKVQVYDRLSDQAQLTGFDDGSSEKTINLTLKKDKKKGAFGKAMAGMGTDGRYEGQLNINSFKGARQLSALATMNNTNTEGFSFMDMMNFTGELKRLMRQGNGNISVSSDDAKANMAGMSGNTNNGIRTIAGAGINYNNIIGNKTDFSSNYFYNQHSPRVISSFDRKYLLPDSSYFLRQLSDYRTTNNTHRLQASADISLDSFHSLKIAPSFGLQQNRINNYDAYSQFGEDMQESNKGFSATDAQNKGSNFRTDFLFRKKFRRRGRTFSISGQWSENNNSGEGSFRSVNSFTDSINQRYSNNSSLNGFNARLVYTEPIGKRSLVELSASGNYTRQASERSTFDFNANSSSYDIINTALTNDFRNNYNSQQAGVRWRNQTKKYQLAIGASWQNVTLEGTVTATTKDSVIRKSFRNLIPNARFQYNFSRQKNLQLYYRPYTSQPEITELQPLTDISSPLHLKQGNPSLQQEFIHFLQLNYTGINPFRNRNLFAYFTLTRTDNKIVNADTLFANGTKLTRPVNTDGVYNFSGDISLGRPIRFLKANFQAGTTIGWQKGKQFINGFPNTISVYSAGPRISLDMVLTEKINASARANIEYNNSRYSLQPAFNTSYISQYYEFSVDWQMPRFFYFSTEFNYSVNNQLSAGYNARIPLWNASLSKQFLRFRRAQLSLRVRDLLNKNIKVERSSNQNYIEDRRINTLQRFAILSFTYNLSKTGASQEGGPGQKIIRR